MLKYLLENVEARGLEPVFAVEAGLVLTGSETKALRLGNGRINGSYLKFIGDEPHLVNFKVGYYKRSNDPAFSEDRTKKVLLNKKEIDKINGLLSQKGLSCVPARVYSKNRFLKVQLVVGRMPRKFEKRDREKKREQEREIRAY